MFATSWPATQVPDRCLGLRAESFLEQMNPCGGLRWAILRDRASLLSDTQATIDPEPAASHDPIPRKERAPCRQDPR